MSCRDFYLDFRGHTYSADLTLAAMARFDLICEARAI
jgi:hypothetical protein